MRGFLIAFLWLAGSASAGSVVDSSFGQCGIIFGPPISSAYTGQYVFESAASIDFYVVGSTAVASVRLGDGRWYEGTAFVQPNELALAVPLTGPDGAGELLMCAMTKRSNGKITATVFVSDYQQVGPHHFDKVL